MSRTAYDDEGIKKAVQTSFSIAQVLDKLGLVAAGGNYAVIKRKIRNLGLSTVHFTQQGWRKGRSKPAVHSIPLSHILVEKAAYSTYKLKRRLIAEGIKEHKCESCGLESWLGKPIPLELHHVNGVSDDFRLGNIQLLCPNCHALTENYRGKNKRVARKLKARREAVPKPRKFDPEKAELEKLVWEMPTVQVARHFEVSDKAIEKRCKLLGIDKPPRGYWARQSAKTNNVPGW